jgi:hypothetical protein
MYAHALKWVPGSQSLRLALLLTLLDLPVSPLLTIHRTTVSSATANKRVVRPVWVVDLGQQTLLDALLFVDWFATFRHKGIPAWFAGSEWPFRAILPTTRHSTFSVRHTHELVIERRRIESTLRVQPRTPFISKCMQRLRTHVRRKPHRISQRDGVPLEIGIRINAALQTNRVALRIVSESGVVLPVPVLVKELRSGAHCLGNRDHSTRTSQREQIPQDRPHQKGHTN